MAKLGQWGLRPDAPATARGFPFVAAPRPSPARPAQAAPAGPRPGQRPAPASLGAEAAALEARRRELAGVVAHLDGPALSAAREAAGHADALAAVRPSARRRERATELARKVASMEAARDAAAKEAQAVARALASAQAALGVRGA